MFMSSGTGCWMISLNNFSPNSILLSHSVGTRRGACVRPTKTRCGRLQSELTAGFAPRSILVGQPDTER